MKEAILLIGEKKYPEFEQNAKLLEILLPDYVVCRSELSQCHNVFTSSTAKCMCAVIDIRHESCTQALAAIKALLDLDAELPIIMWLGYGEEAFAHEAVKNGAYDFITKPIESEKVMLCLQHACDVRRMRGYITRLEKHIAEQTDISADERKVIMMNQMHHLLVDDAGKIKPLKSLEKEIIIAVLRYTGGCVAQAARSLGIGRSTLYRKVGEYNIQSYIRRENHTTRPVTTISSIRRSTGG